MFYCHYRIHIPLYVGIGEPTMRKILVIAAILFLMGCDSSNEYINDCMRPVGASHGAVACAFETFGWMIGNGLACDMAGQC